MKIQPKVPRTTPISADVRGVKVRYDPLDHADGLDVPDALGAALVKTGHWVEVKRPPRPPKVSALVDNPKTESAPHDSIQS